MERVILHCDCDNFYASVESLYRPELRGKPFAVVGDPDKRHGIVLAKSCEAKSFGVKTGNPLWLARRLCPDILFVPPHFDLYMNFSRLIRDIYYEYTDRVEPLGLDECWLDLTGSVPAFDSGKTVADRLRERVKKELGITISAGGSFNKVFAKLGSDYKKPDATTVIPVEDFRQIVWPLPVSSLLFVGRSTAGTLERKGIRTIGGLANAGRETLKSWFGKCGETLWMYANGYDSSPVAAFGWQPQIKSIGNSTTLPRDLKELDEIKITLMALSESVAERLRKHNFNCETVQIGIRDTGLSWIERQSRLKVPTCDSTSIYQKALELFCKNWVVGKPVRSLGVRACNLSSRQVIQLSLLKSVQQIRRREEIEEVVDSLRFRFGGGIVRRGIMLSDKASSISPQKDFSRFVFSTAHGRK